MSWGNEAVVSTAQPATVQAPRCAAPNCNNYATVVIMYGEEQRNSCGSCISEANFPIVGLIEGAQHDLTTRDALLAQWETSKEALERSKTREMDVRKLVFAFNFPTPKEGTQRVELGNGYNLKAVHKVNTTISASNEDVDKAEDAASKCGNEGTFLFERIITWTPNFSKSEYKKLEASNPTHIKIKALVDGLITEKPGAPALEIEAPKATLNG
jgi:hypothetical protein